MKLASKVMQKDDRLLNIKNFFLLYIIVSIRPILWPWSHNSYKWVSTKFQCYFIKIATSKSFIFYYLLCKQIDGVTMGSPLGPTLVGAFLFYYENEWLDNFPIHFNLWCTKGMLMILLFFFHLQNTSNIQPFVNYMNKQHKCLKLTYEVENDNTFSFLDIKITRHNKQF